jgi:hypothetical protein
LTIEIRLLALRKHRNYNFLVPSKNSMTNGLITSSVGGTARAVLAEILGPLIFAFAAACVFMTVSEPSRGNLQASDDVMGCNPFGYVRGADLFREQGIVGGFDTAIRAPEVAFLIDVGKTTARPVRDWSEAIAPACHHLEPNSGKVILQYPPGTALLLSWLPKGHEAISLVVAMGTVIATTLYFMMSSAVPVASRALLAVLVFGTVQLLDGLTMHASFSVPWAITFIPVLALAGLNFCRATGRWQIILGLILGIVSALLIQVRLPNIFIVAGVGVYIAAEGRLWRSESRRRHGVATLAGLVSFLLLGPILLGIYNAANTGTAFHSTYTGEDAKAITLSKDVILENLNYYYINWDFAVITRLCAIVTLMFALHAINGKSERRNISTAICVLFVYCSSTVFFALHNVTAPYYLLPSDLFILYFFALTLCKLDRSDRTPRWPRWAAVGGIAALVASQVPASSVAPRFTANIPAEVLRPNSIVWAFATSGSLLNYNNKYAAKLISAEQCTQQNSSVSSPSAAKHSISSTTRRRCTY